MPAKSLKQKRFMQAVAHNPAFAAKVGVPQKVGAEFSTGPVTPAATPKKRHNPMKHGYTLPED